MVTEQATHKFQLLGRVCEILTDEDRRKLYDQTGHIDEDNDSSNFGKDVENWYVSPTVGMTDI